MTYQEEQKMKAALKIGKGVWNCFSGVSLATGHHILSGVLRTPGARMPFARQLLESGQKSIKEGMAEWNK